MPALAPTRPLAPLRAAASIAVAAILAAGLVPLGAASAAQAAPTDFTTSFEAAETARPYANRVELDGGDPVQQNVRGALGGSILSSVLNVTASGQNAPGEAAIYAADADANTKWLVFTNTGWLQYGLSAATSITKYTVSSADDAPERDPKNWRVLGSNNGTDWTTVDTQTDQNWTDAQRKFTKTYTIPATAPFSIYRLDISANHSNNIIQISGFEPFAPVQDENDTPITTVIGSGPSAGYNMKARVGFTGMNSLRYSGQHVANGEAFATNRLFDVSIPVIDTTRLSYNIFPELTANDFEYPSTYAAISLHFTDGTSLAGLEPLDSYGTLGTARGQGEGKILYANQWNNVRVDVGAVAAGKTIDGIQLSYDNPAGTAATAFQGWVDDVSIEANPARVDGSSLTNYVDTRRGTNSSSAFSRGSNEAITSWPNGFNFLVPVTNATAQSREYSYQADNTADNKTRFEGLGISHEPSPWMGDRNQFSVMPVAGGTAPSGNPRTRAQTFSHANETAQPDFYSVKTDNNIVAEMTPTNHGMVMQFTFTGNANSVVIDSPTGDGEFTINASTGAVTGWIDKGSGFIAGQSRMFVSGTFDQVPTSTGTAAGGRALTKYATFNTTTSKTVTLRLATSLISLDQAAKNLALEVGAKSFATVRNEARAIWNERLGVIRVEGATETELKTLYGNLYRLNVYPNAQFENTGTAQTPVYKYASPVSPQGADTATVTGAKVVAGKMYVNNGFWDTYRTAWPLYAMLYPELSAELIDGFTDQYRDGGWIARWSSPGYANIMTGTSSDVAFADAYLRGVDLPDALATYDAAVKNASTPSTDQNVGRKSLATSAFLGFTPASQGESVSWATEGYINDYGIGNMAAKLAEDPDTPASRRPELREQAEFYLDRAKNYVNMFDPEIEFFQARNADGSFVVPADEYNPKQWWGPYTETNGWNFAFHAPQDPNGLANLYGGRQGLEDKLDEFFATPELSLGPIHEEVEARDGRYGQWGVSNQVSHHIPFIYNAAGAPAKAQKIVREALQRSFTGTEIGQGYPGDEDNGEMSAWYIFNALGFYPLQVGSTDVVLGSPLFTKATVSLAGGKSLVINAPNNSASNVYVQSLRVNGQNHTSTSIDSNILTEGAVLDFTMGSTPSTWGTRAQDAPPSLTSGTKVAEPLVDTTDPGIATVVSAGGENPAALVDNTSTTQVTFATATPSVTVTYGGAKQRPTFYTLTSGASAADPSDWVLEGSNDGVAWTTVDERTGIRFANRNETKPFKVANPAAFKHFRFTVSGGDATIALAEMEFLTDGSGAEANELAFSPAAALTADSGVSTTFALGILSGGQSSSYEGTIDWGDGSAASAVDIAAPRLGNHAVSATHTFAEPGVYRATLTVGDGLASRVVPLMITVDYVDPTSLRGAFNSVCIADDGVGGNCDAKGISFPRAGLKAGGLDAGVEHGVPGTDLTFTMPVVPVGAPDNATGAGQTIRLDLGADATKFSFIGAATEKNQDTTATVTFTDGTTATTPLQFSDWTKGGNAGAVAPYGNIEVVKSTYRLVGPTPSNTASFFFSTVPYTIPTGKTVESVTLPVQPGEPGVTGRVHIFAIASNGEQPDLTFEATGGESFDATAGKAVTVPLATAVTEASLKARVQWGDGTVTENATITVDGTAVTINGTHTYAAAGTYEVSVTVANETATEHFTLTATVEAAPVVYDPSLSAKESVTAGAAISVKGTGFAPGETVEVSLQTPSPVTVSVTAKQSGDIHTTLKVAKNVKPGRYAIVATGEVSAMPATVTVRVKPKKTVGQPVEPPTSVGGGSGAVVTVSEDDGGDGEYVANPSVTANATTGRVGDLVTVLGEGFAPDEQLTVEVHSDPIVVGTPVADRRGTLNFQFAVPDGLEAGQHTIVVTGEESQQPVELAFEVLPEAQPGDGSTSGNGPTDPSVIANQNTDASLAWIWFVAGGVALALLVLGIALLVRRRRAY
jgi:predicted alpha-1,2-mannosidase